MGDIMAGISGGRTSAMMLAEYVPRDAVLLFQNTGLEHPATYRFLCKIAEHFGRKITWVEWRPPERTGAPPREFRFAEVTPDTAHVGFDLMRGMLTALAQYRALQGKPPVTPWARQRICTSYLKHRLGEKYMISRGHDAWLSLIGLRADEPARVVGLRNVETRRKTFGFPLYDADVTEPMVRDFWRRQSFDLEIESYQGNCTGCFLKDQSDLARLMHEPETMAEGWYKLERDFPRFGGDSKVPYFVLASEAPFRAAVRAHFTCGDPMPPPLSDPRRSRLVVLQEKRRIEEGSAGFSCGCEAALLGEDSDD